MEATGPSAVLLRGLELISRGERVEAWREIRRASETAPRDGLVCVLAARLLYLLGDYQAALDATRAAMNLGVESAAMLRFDQARAIGRYHEARAVLEQLLRAGRRVPGPPSADAVQDKTFDRALGHLLRLYLDAHYYEGAATALDTYLPLTRGSPTIHLRAARLHERRGDTDLAVAAIRRALAAEPPTTAVLLEAAPLLVQIGAFGEARALYEALLAHDAAALTALEALGRLCLWRGDTDGALAYAERLSARDARSSPARRIGAAVRVLTGDYAGALPMLDAVLRDDPHDGEAYVWRAEARLRLGRTDEALADAQRSPPGAGHSFAARAMYILAALTPSDDHVAGATGSASATPRLAALRPGRWLRRRLTPSAGADARTASGITAHARREFAAELTAIDAQAPSILASNSAAAVADLLERAVVAMRGNRTPLATWVRDDGTLARLPPSTSARVASRRALELIKVASPEETLRRFDAVIARFPDSSMPLVHRGELHLWLGRYAEARADLEAAIAIQRQTRWAWYGLASLDLLAGNPERALATCAFGIQVMDHTEGPVAFLYRGEAYRLLGRLDEARQQLVRACELHPGRLSAWINLAIVHGAAGDHAAERDIVSRLATAAPSLLSEAAFELGEDVFRHVVLEGSLSGARPDASPDGETIDRVLKHALAMMRGNRSSSCITFFSCDGQLRHVVQGQRIDPAAEERTLAQVRQALIRAIKSRRTLSN